jgi:L-histidine N-alpha-methyltransferase
MPHYGRRMILFIGSTIGNFEPSEAVSFLASIAEEMNDDDRLVLGTDLVKDHHVLNAAYNDELGLTADFNKNILRVLNRELRADFNLKHFEHRAQFVPDTSQIELRLRSKLRQKVRFAELDWEVDFAEGETILTEISRKFTRTTGRATLEAAGLELLDWHTPDNDYFALSVSRRRRAGRGGNWNHSPIDQVTMEGA